jgi:hypothetical protein
VPVARLASTSLDCADPFALAEFWAALVGGEVAYRSEQFCAVRTDHGWLAAVKVDGYRPPTLRLGAKKADMQRVPDRYRVFFDPAGHPFCLTTQIPE